MKLRLSTILIVFICSSTCCLPLALADAADAAVGAADAGESAMPASMPNVKEATSVGQTWWQALIFDIVFKAIVPIFVPVLATLLLWLLRKIGIKIELETLDKLAKNAAEYGEQKGVEWLKENGAKMPGALKEAKAWELVESINAKFKGKEKLRKKLRGMILSKIPDAEAKVKEKEKVKVKSESTEEKAS